MHLYLDDFISWITGLLFATLTVLLFVKSSYTRYDSSFPPVHLLNDKVLEQPEDTAAETDENKDNQLTLGQPCQ